MPGRSWLQGEADQARRENPSLISGYELEQRRVAEKQAEQADRREEQMLAEITRLREVTEAIERSLNQDR